MFDCNRCLKNDVCMKKQKLRDLDLNKILDAFVEEGLRFNLTCVNYLPSTKILGGQSHELYKQ